MLKKKLAGLIVVIILIAAMIFIWCGHSKVNPSVCTVDWSAIDLHNYKGKQLECTPADLYEYGENYIPSHDYVDVMGVIVDVSPDSTDKDKVVLTICDTAEESDEKLFVCVGDNGDFSIGTTLEVKGHISPYYYKDDDLKGGIDNYSIYVDGDDENVNFQCIDSKHAISVSESLSIGENLYESVIFKVKGKIYEEPYFDVRMITDNYSYLYINIYTKEGEYFEEGENVVLLGNFYKMKNRPTIWNATIEHSKFGIISSVLKYVLGIAMGMVALLLFISYVRSEQKSNVEK